MMNKILALYPDLEDHHILHEAFADSHNEIVCVTTVSEAVRLLVEQSFTLVLIDSKVIDRRSDEIATTIKTISNVPVIIADSVVYAKKDKTESPHGMEHHHKHGHIVHSDSGLHYHKVLTFDQLVIDPNRREVLLNGSSLCLTKIEFDIVYFLARHKGRVMSRDQIYANVWMHDSSFDVDELVKAHIKRLRKKFSPSNHEYIQNVRGVGYKFSD